MEKIQSNNKTQNKKKDKTTNQEDKRKKVLLIIIIFIISFFLCTWTLDNVIMGKPNKPIITKSDNKWHKSKVIRVEKDSTSIKEIDYYLYCIRQDKNKNKCTWKKTFTKNAIVSTTGINYVWFRGVNKNGIKGKISNKSIVKIDNESPKELKATLDSTTNSININVIAKDYESGIENYYYSIDNNPYIKSNKSKYTYENLNPNTLYKIKIKVEDKLKNSKEIELSIRTKSKQESSEKNKETTKDNNKETKKDNNKETSDNNKKEQDDPEKKTDDTDDFIPEISLENVPSVFTYKDKYKLPSRYKFGPSGGKTICTIDNEEYKDTSTIGIGKKEIICSAIGNNGKTTKVTKQIEVKQQTGEDLVFDGYIRLNINYPENSTERMWKLKDENTTRTDGWIDYTGPILVKLTDVENVYIKYKSNGKEIIKNYQDKLVVDINPDSYSLEDDKETNVEIKYTSDAEQKQYKINDEEWQNYNGTFKVRKNTKIEARVAKKNSNGQNQISYDSVYIKERKSETIDQPEDLIDGPIITTNTQQIVEDVDVSIETKEEPKIVYYKLNNDQWQEYTGKFNITKNTNIYAKYITKDGKSSKTSSLYVDNIKQKNKPYVKIDVDTTNTTQKVVVTISAKDYETLEYSTDGNEYKKYTSPIDVTTNTTIYAKATNKYGQTIEKRIINNIEKPTVIPTPSYSIDGPIIKSSPEELTQQVQVSIETEKKAQKIYYKIGNGTWKEYKEKFNITNNGYIYAKYVTEEGQTSKVSNIYIDNIKQNNKPHVSIKVNTIQLSKEVIATITASDYNTLEYSFDGVIYYPYQESLTIKTNTTIYAKATNDYGQTIEKREITNIDVEPTIKDNLIVSIFLTPDKEGLSGLVNTTTASIIYDNRCENKYYKVGNSSSYKEYTGNIVINQNSKIYGYCTSKTGRGSDEKSIDFLTTGVSEPTIKQDTTSPTEEVKVTIDYPSTAKIKKYRIDDGELIDYTEPFTIKKNCKIYAYVEDYLKNTNSSTKEITNIIKIKRYDILDKGKYFILKLNYPSTSKKESREYKWTINGEWKKYDTKGILLIKSEYKDEIIKDGNIHVEDENGNIITFTDHYYIVDMSDANIIDNLFLRWDKTRPSKPKIKLSTTSPTRELTVNIDYDDYSSKKEYKIIDNGIDSGWKTYDKEFKINKNDVVIYARGTTSLDIEGEISTKKITNIDLIDPEITVKGNLTTPARTVTLQLVGKDNMSIEYVGYMKGKHTAEEIENKTTLLKNNQTFKVKENGIYTIYAIDKAGNKTTKQISVENIDNEAPDIDINILTKEYGSTLDFEIYFGDSKTKKYKIGKNGTYENYTKKVSVESKDIYSLANEDGSITIYAQGIDSAGNIKEVSEKTYIIDLDIPKAPIIKARTGYPILTEYGVEYDDVLSVEYDKRDDIINYISTDGKTWKEYTGIEHITNKKVYAKSIKKSSSLTVESSVTVEQPTDAIGMDAFDGNESTFIKTSKKNYAYVDESLQNKSIIFVGSYAGTAPTFEFLDENDNVLLTVNKFTTVTIPENTVKISYVGTTSSISRNYNYLKEIEIDKMPVLNVDNLYPTVKETGIEKGHSIVTIDYFETSIKKLYSLDDGITWKDYTKGAKIDLSTGSKVMAKGIDKYGNETKIATYTSELPDDALGEKAYDGNQSTYVYKGILMVDKSMIGYKLNFSVHTIRTSSKIQYMDKDENIILTSTGGESIIPEGTVKIKYIGNNPTNYYYQTYLKEVTVVTTPIINSESVYPELTFAELKRGYSKVNIKYFPTTIKKLYKIDDGDWNEYNNEPIKVELGKTIYAKGIDKNGNETEESSYKSVLEKDALGEKAYDGDSTTKESGTGTNYLKVSQDMIGEYVNINWQDNSSSDVIYLEFLDEERNVIGDRIQLDNLQKVTMDYMIPEKTEWIKFYVGKGCYIYEIKLLLQPKINLTTEQQELTSSGIKTPKEATATIKYNKTSVKKLYKIDDGEWQEYKNKIKVEYGKTIYAKGIDKDGIETQESSYKVEILNSLGNEAYDGDLNTSYILNNDVVLNIDKNTYGLEFNIQGYRSNTINYIKILDKDGNELYSKDPGKATNYDLTITIPENAYKLLITKGDSNSKIKEISVSKYYTSPTISVDDLNWTSDKKTITITYALDSYNNEYSFDGENWYPYTGSIEITEPTTVFARSSKNNKVVSSSSYQFTKFDQTIPTISLDDIPDTINYGDSYTLPSSATFDNSKSGGSSICYVDSNEVANTKDIISGTHTITCTATTGAGKKATISKDINIIFEDYSNYITFTGGKYNSKGSSISSPTSESLDDLKDVLTNDDTTTKYRYGSLLLSANMNNVQFTLEKKVNMSFSSKSYSDSGGSSGKEVYFYKIDDSGQENLYYTLQQKNNTNNYGTYTFEQGNYILRSKSNYAEFNKWIISKVGE